MHNKVNKYQIMIESWNRVRRCLPAGKAARSIMAAAAMIAVSACASAPSEGEPGPAGESMTMDQLLQSDFNRTITMAMRDNLDSLYRLQEKLYRRNPGHWKRAGHADLEAALKHGQQNIQTASPPQRLDGLQDIEILSVSLDPAYTGDRVEAFIYGLADMILTAHQDKSRFYVADNLDAQHIFNAARNVEIAAWLLNSRRDDHGEPLLLANELTDQSSNLSFEREFGQLVGRLDLVANLLDEKLRRVGINYLQGLLFFNFLPVR